MDVTVNRSDEEGCLFHGRTTCTHFECVLKCFSSNLSVPRNIKRLAVKAVKHIHRHTDSQHLSDQPESITVHSYLKNRGATVRSMHCCWKVEVAQVERASSLLCSRLQLWMELPLHEGYQHDEPYISITKTVTVVSPKINSV